MNNYTSNTPFGYCHCGCGQKTNLAPRNSTKIGLVKGEPQRYIKGHQHAAVIRQSFSDRFWSHVDIDPAGCWLWASRQFKEGYGSIDEGGRNSKRLHAHRVAWELTNGAIPDGLCVLHKCDVPACCNPSHLFLGTRLDNNRDKVEKRRQAKGETHSRHRLTDQEVLYVREQVSLGYSTIRELSNLFDVSYNTIRYIVKGKTWKHI